MAGVACVEQILKHAPNFEITIFGDETHVNYNRILLSLVLAGEKSPDDIILNDLDWYQQNGIRARLGVRIVDIESGSKDGHGRRRQRHAFRQADSRHRQQRFHSADPGCKKRRRPRVPHP